MSCLRTRKHASARKKSRLEMRYKSKDGRGITEFDNASGHLLGMEFTQKFELGMTLMATESVSLRGNHVKVSLKREAKPQPME